MAGRRLTDAESKAKLQAQAGGGKYPRRQDTAVDCVYTGEVTCPLVLEVPRTLWSPGPNKYGRPIADKGTTRVASIPLLLLELASDAGRPTFMETLVNRTLYERAQSLEGADKERMEQHSVEAYRFWWPHDTFSIGSVSALMNTRFAKADGAMQVFRAQGGRGRPAREPGLPGSFCVDPRRFQSWEDWRRALAQLRMGWPQDALRPGQTATYEVRQAIAAAGPAQAMAMWAPVGFGGDSDDEDGSVPSQASAANTATGTSALDTTHVCFPLLADVFARNKVVKLQHQSWRLHAEQTNLAAYVEQSTWQVPQWVVNNNLMRVVDLSFEDFSGTCLPEYRPSEMELQGALQRAADLINLDISSDVHDFNCYDLADPYDVEPISAPVVADEALGEQEAVVARRYPDAVAAMKEIRAVQPFYRQWNMYPEFIARFSMLHRRLYRSPQADGAPDVYYKVHKETQALLNMITSENTDDTYVWARDQISDVPARLAGHAGAESFENWFTSWFGHLLLDWGQLTRVQAAIADMAMGNLSRVPELLPSEMAVMMIVLGGFGIGKSEVTKIMQQCWPTAGHSEASQTFSKCAHLADRIAQIMFMDEYDPTNETLELRSRAMLGVTKHVRHEQDADGNWGNKLYENLNVPNLFASGNTAPGGAIRDRAQLYVVPNHQDGQPDSTMAKVMAPNRRERRSLLMIGRLLNGWKYEYYEGVNLGGVEIDRTMIHVTLAIAEQVLGARLKKLTLRQIAQMKASAVALFVKDVTALWNLKVKQGVDGPSERHMWEFYAQYSVVQGRHALIALERVLRYSDQSSLTAQVTGALRSHIRYAQGQYNPVRCDDDPRYFELDMPAGSETDAVTATLRSHGRGVIDDALNRIREQRWQGGQVLKVAGGGRRGKTVAVLADFILRPEIQTGASAKLWAALQWFFSNHPDTWMLDYETEQRVVFSKAVRDCIRSAGRDDTGLPVPPSLEHINPDTARREFAMMDLTGEFEYNEEAGSAAVANPLSVWCARVVGPPPSGSAPPGQPVIENGGISITRAGDNDLFKQRQLQSSCLAVSLEEIQTRLGMDEVDDENSRKLSELRQWVLAVEGATDVGEKYVSGLNATGDHILETHVFRGWPGKSITVINPNRSVTARGVHTVAMPEDWNADAQPINVIFPRKAAEVCFTPSTRVWDIVHAQFCLNRTGLFPAQEWERIVVQYANRRATIRVGGAPNLFMVSKKEKRMRSAILRHSFVPEDSQVWIISPRRMRVTDDNAAEIWALDSSQLLEFVVEGGGHASKRTRV